MRIITGRALADTIRGTTVAEQILADAGNDTVYGGGGNDLISGGTGNDALYGEAGNDTLNDIGGIDIFNGGDGYDTLDYTGSAGRGVDVFLHLGYGGRDASGDTYTSIENVTGTAFQDFLWGTTSDNVINGAAGNDYLRGFAGNDQLLGGAGNDQMYGDAGYDTYRPGSGFDTIVGGLGLDRVSMTQEKTAMLVDFVDDRWAGELTKADKIDAEALTATNLNDEIYLTQQTWKIQILDGAGGDDVLEGAVNFSGGLGEDTIILRNNSAEKVNLQLDMGIDTIDGFTPGEDKLSISKAHFGLTSNAAGNPVYSFVDTTDAPVALIARASFIYEKTTQILWFDADGTGTAKSPIAIADFDALPQAMSTGVITHPTAADLIFVG
ncbi:MAG: hypothetical protein HOP09_08175 [Hyphomicrobium sp.]|nr:hypothetical protein [Hyphomicrobium sp.]